MLVHQHCGHACLQSICLALVNNQLPLLDMRGNQTLVHPSIAPKLQSQIPAVLAQVLVEARLSVALVPVVEVPEFVVLAAVTLSVVVIRVE
jgi:hypothetical protein